MKNSVAIITARGGSKRIPRKNIKLFCGKPIIQYSIEAALNSKIFDEVMVSTDDLEIAQISKKLGAKVPFMRSAKASDDFATTVDVLLEVFSEYEKLSKYFKYACCIYPTAPFITSKKLKNAMDVLIKNDSDSVVPVVKFSFPPQRGFIINQNNRLEYEYPKFQNCRSQDLEPIYHDCGQFYCFKVDSFRKFKNIITNNTSPIIMPELEVQDIDNMEDWHIAEIKYKLMQGEGSN